MEGNGRSWMVSAAALFVGYGVYSGVRKVLSTCTPEIKDDLQLSKTEIGSIWSWFAISYGLAKFFGGVSSDLVVGRHLFCGGLLLTGIATLSFSYSSSLRAQQALWFCNGIAQGFGWPSLAKIVLDTFPKQNIGTIWSIMNMSGNVGYMLSPAVYLLVSEMYSWRAAFLLAGAVSVAFSVLLYPTLPANKTTTPSVATSSNAPRHALQTQSSFVTYSWVLLQNPAFVLICFSDICTYFAIKATADWMTLYLNESWMLPVNVAASLVFWAELGGVLGAFLCGPLSDLLHGNRALISIVFSTGCMVALLGMHEPAKSYNKTDEDHAMAPTLYSIVVVAVIGFFMNAPKTLSGIAVKDVTSAEMRGTAVGVLGLAGQAGAYMSGAPLGFLLEKHGWYTFPLVLTVCCGLSALAMLGVHLLHSRTAKQKAE